MFAGIRRAQLLCVGVSVKNWSKLSRQEKGVQPLSNKKDAQNPGSGLSSAEKSKPNPLKRTKFPPLHSFNQHHLRHVSDPFWKHPLDDPFISIREFIFRYA